MAQDIGTPLLLQASNPDTVNLLALAGLDRSSRRRRAHARRPSTPALPDEISGTWRRGAAGTPTPLESVCGSLGWRSPRCWRLKVVGRPAQLEARRRHHPIAGART
jgi:hypothetical protein